MVRGYRRACASVHGLTQTEHTGRNRTPKWVLKAGLVRPQDPRGGKHKWAGRYDERLPDSARTGYSDGPEGYEGNGTGDWDGRGPEPSRHKGRRDFLTPWNDEVDLGEEQNGNGAGDEYRLSRPQSRTGEFDPLENEAFYSSGGAANISDSEARKRRHKQKGPKGAFHKHKDRYLNPDKSTAPDRFGTMDAARRSSSRREDEYQDDFERNLNQEAVAAKRKPAAEPEGPEDPWAIKPQPTGNGSSEPEQQQQQKRSEDFLNHTF